MYMCVLDPARAPSARFRCVSWETTAAGRGRGRSHTRGVPQDEGGAWRVSDDSIFPNSISHSFYTLTPPIPSLSLFLATSLPLFPHSFYSVTSLTASPLTPTTLTPSPPYSLTPPYPLLPHSSYSLIPSFPSLILLPHSLYSAHLHCHIYLSWFF